MFHFDLCGLSAGTITLAEAGSIEMDRCHSEVAGTGSPVFDFGTAIGNTNVQVFSSNGSFSGTDTATVSDGRFAFTSAEITGRLSNISAKRLLEVAWYGLYHTDDQ